MSFTLLRTPVVAVLASCTLVACDEPRSTPSSASSATAAPSGSIAVGVNPPAPQLAEGAAAPSLTLALHDGTSVDLAGLKDDIVLIYFYPKDDTPGCTVEAQGLRDHFDALTSAGVKVYGVSLQDAASHKAFIEKHDLPFPLVVDDGKVAAAFDVPVSGEFAQRHSFLLKGGKVVKVWRKVRPAGHAEEVLAAAKALST